LFNARNTVYQLNLLFNARNTVYQLNL